MNIGTQLAKVSDLWLDTTQPLRQETVSALQVSTGLFPREIDLALINCFEELRLAKTNRFVSNRSTLSVGSTWNTLHILPSNAFTSWVHGAAITLLLGGKCDLKPSSREPVFARAWKKSLEQIDPSLARHVNIVAWNPKDLERYRAVLAYGSDETLSAIQAQLPTGIRFAGYGHKLSVGIIFEEALADHDQLIERIRLDAEPFRLQGCLSPQILYVENESNARWPELDASLSNPPKIRPFEDWGDLQQTLQRFTPYLSCVGYAGREDRGPFLENELQSVGVSRICPLGLMQRPPLDWQNGGIDLSNLLN